MLDRPVFDKGIVLPMKFIADLHIHSHYSRAGSSDPVPEFLAFWAPKKGILLTGTGDLTSQ